MRQRLMIVGAVVSILAVAPLWKLIGVQVRDGSELVARGENQRFRELVLPASRGSIVDRNGVELAISVARLRVAVSMVELREEGIDTAADIEQFGRQLSELIGVDPAPVVERLLAAKPTDPWIRIAETVEESTARRAVEQIEASGVHGAVILEESTERVHPAGDSALRLIGTLGVDGPGKRAGIERAFNDELTGRNGKKVVELGTEGETIAGAERIIDEPVAGSDIELTLDRTLQHEVESILATRAAEANAVRGIAIVGRPSTGEILAAGSVQRDEETGEMVLSDAPIAFSNSYQAGSVFKLVTVAAAVEAGQVDAGTTFSVPSSIQVEDRTFSDHEDAVGTRSMTTTDIVADSSNVGTIKIAQGLGSQALHDALVGFGFGRPTGIGHPAESAGILPPAAEWTAPDLAASGIGTHQSATALQLWAAYNVIANGGNYVAPRLVDSLIAPDGERTRLPAAAPRRVISEGAADQVSAMLQEVVKVGTGEQWNLPGYSVAAKTGTSRLVSDTKVDDEDAYTWVDGRFHHVAAFTGYLPAERPQVSITVILEDITSGLTGSTAAGPVFSDLARLSIRELGIAPSHLAETDAASLAGDGSNRVRSTPAVAPEQRSRDEASANSRSSKGSGGADPDDEDPDGDTTDGDGSGDGAGR